MLKVIPILFVLIIVFAPLSFAHAIENSLQVSKLPKTIPARTVIKFDETGGKGNYKSISISENVLYFEEKRGIQQTIKWAAKISNEDENNLYRVFVNNKFDLIKNDAREGTVYDAGSEGISLTVNNKIYSKNYGPNSPMSGDAQKHYRAVFKAINDLAELYAKSGEKTAFS